MAGLLAGASPTSTATFRGYAPCVVGLSSDLLRRLQAAPASAVIGVLVHGSGRNPRAAMACAVNDDARGRRYLLGDVAMTLTGLPPRAQGESLGPPCRTGQRQRLRIVPLLRALLRLHEECPMRWLEFGDALLWG